MADIHLTCLRNEQEIEVRTSIKIEEAVFIMLRFILPLCCILSWWLLSRFPSLFNWVLLLSRAFYIRPSSSSTHFFVKPSSKLNSFHSSILIISFTPLPIYLHRILLLQSFSCLTLAMPLNWTPSLHHQSSSYTHPRVGFLFVPKGEGSSLPLLERWMSVAVLNWDWDGYIQEQVQYTQPSF